MKVKNMTNEEYENYIKDTNVKLEEGKQNIDDMKEGINNEINNMKAQISKKIPFFKSKKIPDSSDLNGMTGMPDSSALNGMAGMPDPNVLKNVPGMTGMTGMAGMAGMAGMPGTNAISKIPGVDANMAKGLLAQKK